MLRQVVVNGSLVALAFILGLGCTHTHTSKVDELVASGDCEKAANHLGKDFKPTVQIVDDVQRLGGTTVSYGVTAIGYTADVVVVGAVGVVSATVFCPVFVAQMAACIATNRSCQFIGDPVCFSDPFAYLPRTGYQESGFSFGPGLGSKAYGSTVSWRQDAHAIGSSQALRKIAACYEGRDTTEDLVKASLQLRQIHDSDLYNLVSIGERERVDRDIARVKARLRVRAPDLQSNMDQQRRELALAAFASPIPALWRDLKTGMTWRLLESGAPDGKQAKAICDSASLLGSPMWHLPNRAEAERAVRHGLTDPALNPSFASAIKQKFLVYVSSGYDQFAVLELATGEVTEVAERDTAGSLPLLCVQ